MHEPKTLKTQPSGRNAHWIQCLPRRVKGCLFWASGYQVGEEGIFRGKEKMFLFIELFVLALYLCLWSTWTSVLHVIFFSTFVPFSCSFSADPPRNAIHCTAILAKSHLFKQLCRGVQSLMQILVLFSRIIHIASLLTFFTLFLTRGWEKLTQIQISCFSAAWSIDTDYWWYVLLCLFYVSVASGFSVALS